jgi:choline dehydrogenase-like flavoprotein
VNYVIGSGPAGVAAATALLDTGRPVTMLDAGGELEAPVGARVEALSKRLPDEWTTAERDALRGPLRYNSEGAPLKLLFGSDYAYRDTDALQPVVTEGVDAYRALAAGGLSALWGAAILPYADADFDEWPVTAAEMHRHYVSALQLTGLAAAEDGLAPLYPLHVPPTATLEMSAQARAVMNRMTQHADALRQRRVYFGKARLAIGEPPGAVRSCVHCGMCLYGCPYGLIYSARSTLRHRLARSESFRYVPGVVVRTLTEAGGRVTIEGVSRDTGQPQRLDATRVYLATGPLASTAILLASLREHTGAVTFAQSDHFLLPMRLQQPPRGVDRERLHTLSQIFLEILDPEVSRRGVHLQVYTYNDLYARMAQDKLGRLYPLLAPAVARLIDRVAVVKGYLHSAESAGIRATLEPGSNARLHLAAVANPASDRVIGAVTRLLSRARGEIGAAPIRLGLRKGLPGSGVHVGGSFPMRRRPGPLETDPLGVPTRFSRVHVVDATTFPSMPAAPPTLTIMANAFRIAEASCSS